MNKNLSKAIVLLTMWVGIASGCSDKTTVQQQPNVLFIMTDDHTQQALHAYGHGLLDTVLFPNMDRLANEGAIFTQSFVTNWVYDKFHLGCFFYNFGYTFPFVALMIYPEVYYLLCSFDCPTLP